MARGVFGLVGLAATLVFALPVALLGLEFLVRGRTLPGAGLVAVAVLMVVVEEYVRTPGDLPAMLAERTVGRVAETDADGSEDE